MSNTSSYLVTGALGFIGSNFVNYMSQKYPTDQFVVLDVKDYCSSLGNLEPESLKNTEVVIGDIQNVELVGYLLRKFKVDVVFHFAAQSHVDNSFCNSVAFTRTNVLGTHALLEAVRVYQEETNKIQKFIHVSTDEVYGEVNDGVMRKETSVLQPTNPYAASKAGAELLAKSYHISYGLPIVITRGNNVYGKNQYPEKLIPKFICKLWNGEKLTIHGKGESQRNFIHVHDTCTAFETVLLRGEIGEIYNISSDHSNEYTVLEIAKSLIRLFLEKSGETEHVEVNDEMLDNCIEYVEDRKFNDCRYFISSSKLEALGWKPIRTDFFEELKELIDWYKEHKERYGF